MKLGNIYERSLQKRCQNEFHRFCMDGGYCVANLSLVFRKILVGISLLPFQTPFSESLSISIL